MDMPRYANDVSKWDIHLGMLKQNGNLIPSIIHDEFLDLGRHIFQTGNETSKRGIKACVLNLSFDWLHIDTLLANQ